MARLSFMDDRFVVRLPDENTSRLMVRRHIVFRSTTEACRISSVATGAFVDNLSAGAMAVINGYAAGSLQMDIYRGSALIRAIVGAVGDGEDLTDTLSGWDLTSGFTATDATIIDANSFSTAGAGAGVYKTAATIVAYGLYKVSYNVSSTATFQWRFRSSDGLTLYPTSGTIANGAYVTATVGSSSYLRHNSAGQTDITSMANERVTGPSTSGALLFNSSALSTQSVLVNTFAAANYNQSAYTVIISRLR